MTSDQGRAPYFEALRRYASAGRTAFHTPGHIQGRGAHPWLQEALGLDVFELDLCPGLRDLDGDSGSAQGQAQALAAEAYGADRSYFLVNGSTAGNQIMLMSTCHPGDVVLTSRNTHKSIVGGLVVSGARPVYVRPQLDPHSHIAHGVTPAQVELGLDEHPEAKAVLIVSPTYYGACSDVAGIAAVAHNHGVPLLVDEAWGAHFPFHPALPPHALSVGADLVVTGIHKLLGAFTQASMLHAQGPLVDADRVEVVAGMVQSTSASTLLRASLDVVRMQMATEGEALLSEAIALSEEARDVISSHPRLWCLGKDLVGQHGVVAVDPTRLVVNVTGTGRTGYEVDQALYDDHGVVVELSDFANVLANVTIGHCRGDLVRLSDGLQAVADDPLADRLSPIGFVEEALRVLPDQVLSPMEAFHAHQERVRLADSVGRVSAEMAATYPPGIPVLVPGERLNRALVAHLAAQVAAGGRIVGPADSGLTTIGVVRE
ncbi:MAG: aminotransferase class I/II-fold pyridoxal phosphate-dependent enzyme [Actinobacteria bacterium]|nr:aminotransferase class I/II-fold pyridoxal phosphate-dependent enzyme [Actinomycetota bacterium]